MRDSALLLALALTTAVAGAQTGQEDHSAHHPPGDAAAPAAQPAPSRDNVDELMSRMQGMHQRMQAARTPQERQALLDEHMRLMQAGMQMMSRMGTHGGMGMMAPGGAMAGQQGMPMAPQRRGDAAPAMPRGEGMPDRGAMSGMGNMMGMHAAMERRMALMEQMMQMMVDREATMPRK